MCTHNYLHSGLFGLRYSEREQVSCTLRLGEKVRIEIILVLNFEDLKKTKKQKDDSCVPQQKHSM